MNASTLINGLRICAPLVYSVTCFATSALGHHVFDFQEEIEISPPFGLIAFEHVVTENELRVVFGLLGAVFAAFAFLRNYAPFYPRVLTMQARFDDKGVEELLQEYARDPRFDFEVYLDWAKHKKKYLKEIESEIYRQVNREVDFGSGEALTAIGTTTFVVERKALFSQTYQVTGADGHLKITDAETGFDFETGFHLQNTRDAEIRVGLVDMFFRYTFFTTPLFAQSYRFDPTQEQRFGNLVACTRARFFPTAIIGRSLYLIRGKSSRGKQYWYPIAYCEYGPE